jgi:hypothetical protein
VDTEYLKKIKYLLSTLPEKFVLGHTVSHTNYQAHISLRITHPQSEKKHPLNAHTYSPALRNVRVYQKINIHLAIIEHNITNYDIFCSQNIIKGDQQLPTQITITCMA